MFGWLFNFEKRQARRARIIHRRKKKLLRLWSKRDNYEIASKRWGKYDCQCNRLIERTGNLMLKYGSFTPDWFVDFRTEFLEDKL